MQWCSTWGFCPINFSCFSSSSIPISLSALSLSLSTFFFAYPAICFYLWIPALELWLCSSSWSCGTNEKSEMRELLSKPEELFHDSFAGILHGFEVQRQVKFHGRLYFLDIRKSSPGYGSRAKDRKISILIFSWGDWSIPISLAKLQW